MKIMISYQCESQEEAQAVLSAVASIGKEPMACSKQYIEPKEIASEPRENVSPGLPTIGKIGTATKEYIFEALTQGVQPAAKYVEHLKLLWSRGEVKFDGVNYYL